MPVKQFQGAQSPENLVYFGDYSAPPTTERSSYNGPQTYLQRPSSWGRATAGRQDVVSHVHTAMRKVYSLHSSSRQM